MQAVILAGGQGARLRPYTTILPKPLMPIAEKSILEIILMQLKKSGFKDFIFTVGYLAELIEAYFGDGGKWGVKIRYSREKMPLGTAGPLTIIKKLAPSFIAMNGDILCDLNYKNFIKRHVESGKDITICSHNKIAKIDLGVLNIKKGRLCDYIEKPEYSFRVSMGIYGLNRGIIKRMKKGRYYSFPNFVKDRLKAGEPIEVYNFAGRWYDIGSIEDCQAAQEAFVRDREIFFRNQGKG